MSHASDTSHSPVKNQAGTLFENTQMKVCKCVYMCSGVWRKVMRNTVHPVRCSGIWGLNTTLEIVTEDACFQEPEKETLGTSVT